ncbi:MaoC/PaaZ C-terminal domain-containing protein [Porticoccaceae bacterium]|nr:MaoC/PaaZ C-terminal domain-containing protein [Porticoccaceae bacterium]
MTDTVVGTQIPPLTLPPISRYTLALFAGASGDHNPIHIDSDFAKASGMPDVFAHRQRLYWCVRQPPQSHSAGRW